MLNTYTKNDRGAYNFEVMAINNLNVMKEFKTNKSLVFNKKNINSNVSDSVINNLEIQNCWNSLSKSINTKKSIEQGVNSYVNRITSIKTSIKKHAYKLSVIKLPKRDLSRLSIEKILINKSSYTDTIDLKSTTNFDELSKEYIICPSVFEKDAKGMCDSDVKKSNFIFLDIDADLSIDEAKNILDEENLSYLLYTSASHSSNKDKFHIFVPLLTAVKNKLEYKAYWSYLHKLLKSKTDRKCSHPSRCAFPSMNNGIVINKLFRDDLYLKRKELNEYANIEKVIDKTKTTSDINVSEDFLKSLYSLKPDLIFEEQTDKFIKFKRDKNDKKGNVIYYIDQNKKVLFDISKDIQIDLLFSDEEFKEAILADESRDNIKDEIKDSISEHFNLRKIYIDASAPANNKTILIANEGIGKSETLIDFCKQHNVIYGAHTLKRIEEIKSSFTKKGISYKVCLSNEEIFKEFNLSEEFISSYKKACQIGITTNEFIEDNLIGADKLKIDLLNRIEENNKLLLEKDCCIIITIAKLKTLLLKFIKEKNLSTIVLDEFEASDFYSLVTAPPSSKAKGSSHSCLYSEISLTVYKNKVNLMSLLKHHSVIILSTERTKIERIFHNKTDYVIIDHSKLLKASNVIYKINHSTSNIKKGEVTIRDLVIKDVKSLYPFIDEVIVNASDEATVNHLQVRGSNDYSDKKTLVIATIPSPQEQKLFELNCEEFYSGKPSHEAQNDINSTLISCQINQSIGRNSGFRERGKKCVVVLPILSTCSDNRFRNYKLDLTYISSNTNYLEGF